MTTKQKQQLTTLLLIIHDCAYDLGVKGSLEKDDDIAKSKSLIFNWVDKQLKTTKDLP